MRKLLVIFGFLAGCAASAPTATTPTGEPKLAWIQANVFDKNCSASGCHSGGSPAGNMDLTAGNAYGSLLGVPSQAKDKDGKALNRVEAGVPDRSAISLRLAGPYGAMPMMPPGLKLDQYKIDAINNWILAGAPNN